MTSGHNMKVAESTYDGFTNLVKWGATLLACVAMLVIFIIA